MIEEQTIELPVETAEWKTLGDVVVKRTVKATPQDYPDAKFIGMDCIEPHSLKPSFLHDFKDFKSAGNYFRKGQVLYGRMRPYLNKVYRAEFDGACSGEFIVMECTKELLPDYLKYALHSREFVRFANAKTSGDRPRISFEELTDFPLRVPSIEEQQQIVSKIEELFSELDKGIEELKTAQQQLKVYRQAVLKWAFEGRLMNEDVKDGELPEGWKWITLGEICDPKRKCSYGVLVPGDHVEDGVTLLRIGDIDERGVIDQSNMKRISPSIAGKFKRTFLQGGEVVISLVGAIGRTAVVPYSLKGANTARAIGVIPVSDEVSAKFVEAMLRSPNKVKEHNDNAHEVARKTLNLEDVVKSKIPLPTIEKQLEIVQEIESRLSVCDKVEEMMNESLRQAEALRQSILRRAFEGGFIL